VGDLLRVVVVCFFLLTVCDFLGFERVIWRSQWCFYALFAYFDWFLPMIGWFTIDAASLSFSTWEWLKGY